MRFFFIVAFFMFSTTNCDNNEIKPEEGKSVSAKLISSKLAAQGLRLAGGATLTNVTGYADSIGLNFTEDLACGFNVWAADSQTTRSGQEGRSYESFNLGDPVSWTSLGAGLQGECESATVAQVESYFVYMDLHLTVAGEPKVIRVYMGQQAPFEAGDIVLNDGGKLSWYDETAGALVASTATRPTNPRTFTLSKEVPWYDNNGADKIILMEFRIDAASTSYTVTKQTGHVIIDVDFANSGISISDTSDDASILKTISLPFLNTSGSSLLKASLTISEDRPPDDEIVEE